ncbi:MAG: paraslipin, partial [Neisseriaceae bacterium]|nr:paraslipin [Neisseriaceae bacterium]
AESVKQPGGMEAVNLKVAEQYVEAFSKLAKEGNTMILPANIADMGSLVAAGMQIVKSQNAASDIRVNIK